MPAALQMLSCNDRRAGDANYTKKETKMSYDSIKTGMKNIIEALSLAQSSEVVDYEIAPPNQFGYTYILFPEHGDMVGVEKESLADRVYDTQDWLVKIAWNRGTHSGPVNLDELNRKREEVVKAIDNPANWTSFARMLNVAEWNIETYEHYFVLIINVEITDTITY